MTAPSHLKEMQLLLDVWREACRHIEIGEFVARIAPRIGQRLPFELLIVRRVELDRLRLETVATGLQDSRTALPRARTECSQVEMDQVLRWCRNGEVLAGGPEGGNVVLRFLSPTDLTGPVLAGPLASGEE